MKSVKAGRCVVLLQALLACAWLQSASAQINLTIYQSGPGQVEEERDVNVRPGVTALVWQPVAARILPESLWLGAPRGVGCRVSNCALRRSLLPRCCVPMRAGPSMC